MYYDDETTEDALDRAFDRAKMRREEMTEVKDDKTVDCRIDNKTIDKSNNSSNINLWKAIFEDILNRFIEKEEMKIKDKTEDKVALVDKIKNSETMEKE